MVPHQSSTAEEDHEDNEGLKPAVLHYLIARLPQPPPRLTQTSRRVDITTLAALHTDWRDTERWVWSAPHKKTWYSTSKWKQWPQEDKYYESCFIICLHSGKHSSGSMPSSAISEYSSSSSPGFLKSTVLPSETLRTSFWQKSLHWVLNKSFTSELPLVIIFNERSPLCSPRFHLFNQKSYSHYI